MFMKSRKLCKKLPIAAAMLAAGVALSGCNPLVMTAASLGANTGVSHSLGGIIYRTFTAPVRSVETASLGALADMGIKVDKKATAPTGEWVISASTKDRDIEIQLEAVTRRTTRMRVIASDGVLLKDSATATEIVMQTERVLLGTVAKKANGKQGKGVVNAAGGRLLGERALHAGGDFIAAGSTRASVM